MKKFLTLAFLLVVVAAAALILVSCVPAAAGGPATSATASAATDPVIEKPTPSQFVSPQPVKTTTPPAPSAPPTESPTASPTPEPTAPPDPVMEIISGMSDEELLGQMVVLGFYGQSTVPEEVAGFYKKYKVGGVMLFGWNVKTFAQTKKLIGNVNVLNQYPDLPLFVCIDEEGGLVHRFPWSPSTRSAATFGKRNKPKEVYDQFLRVGTKLRETGINLNFAPVLDIAPDPSATFLGNRIYGSDPDKVIPLTNAAIKGTRDAGIVSAGKHFPGHGGTASDSHKVLPRVNDSLKKLQSYALKPFMAAVDSGMEAIMVGHLLVPALDAKWPASLSEKTITGLLRIKMGFKGVVFSDDMRMGGIVNNYDIGEACIRFIEAGGDVVLVGKYVDKQEKALVALSAAVKSGRITRDRLMESAYRIVSLKLRIKASFERPS